MSKRSSDVVVLDDIFKDVSFRAIQQFGGRIVTIELRFGGDIVIAGEAILRILDLPVQRSAQDSGYRFPPCWLCAQPGNNINPMGNCLSKEGVETGAHITVKITDGCIVLALDCYELDD